MTDEFTQLLYRQLVRSVVNSVPDRRVGCEPPKLLDHVRQVFNVDPIQHEQLVQRENQNKPGLDLHVVVVEAKDLQSAKNPYCTLKISKGKSGNAHLLTPRRKSQSNTSLTSDDGTGAKCSELYGTSCAMNSVDPQWGEEFRLPVYDAKHEHVVFSVWSTSGKHHQSATINAPPVLSNDVRRSPNFIHRTKAMVLSKVRLAGHSHSSPDDPHDLAGKCCVGLKSVPMSTWRDYWLPIQSKRKISFTGNDTPNGSLHVRLRLFPHQFQSFESEEPECEFVSIEDYTRVMRQFHRYSASETQKNHELYNGELGSVDIRSEVILEQFANANNISWPARNILSLGILLEWPSESAANTSLAPLDKSGLPAALDYLDNSLRVSPMPELGSLSTDERMISNLPCHVFLWNSAVRYANFVLSDSFGTKTLFPPQSINDLWQLDEETKFLEHLCDLCIFLWIGRSLKDIWIEAMKNKLEADAIEWLHQSAYACMPCKDDECIVHAVECFTEQLSQLSQSLKHHGNTFQAYFHEKIKINYIEMLMIRLDEHIERVSSVIISGLVKYQAVHSREEEVIQDCSRLSMQLYHTIGSLVQICRNEFRESDPTVLGLNLYQEWFTDSLIYWIATWEHVSQTRILRSLKLDMNLEKVDPTANVAESGIIALNILASGVLEDWRPLELRNPQTLLLGTIKVTDIFCEGVKGYCRYLWKLVSKRIQKLTKGQMMTAANTAQHMGQFISDQLPNLLAYEALYESLRSLKHKKTLDEESAEFDEAIVEEQAKSTIDKLIANTIATANGIAHDIVKMLISKTVPELKMRLQENMKPDEYTVLLRKIKQYIQLSYYHETRTYVRCLIQAMRDNLHPELYTVAVTELWNWSLIVLKKTTKPRQVPEYYEEVVSIIEDFHEFMLETTGLPLENSTRREYNNVIKMVKERAMPTGDLILQYYAHLADQIAFRSANISGPWIDIQAGYLRLTARNVYIVIKVMRAGNLPPLDTNGLCDPFVVLDLQPRTLFTDITARETTIIEDTLDPEFNETFYFQASMESFLTHGSVLSITVWDWDHVKLNDLAGEAFLHLARIPAMASEYDIINQDIIRLPLVYPSHEFSGSFEILRERARFDQVARKFLSDRVHTILRYSACEQSPCPSGCVPIHPQLSELIDIMRNKIMAAQKNARSSATI